MEKLGLVGHGASLTAMLRCYFLKLIIFFYSSLHFNITEDMLRGIFEPFGKIDQIQLIMDTETNRSKGYGFITVSFLQCNHHLKNQLQVGQ